MWPQDHRYSLRRWHHFRPFASWVNSFSAGTMTQWTSIPAPLDRTDCSHGFTWIRLKRAFVKISYIIKSRVWIGCMSQVCVSTWGIWLHGFKVKTGKPPKIPPTDDPTPTRSVVRGDTTLRSPESNQTELNDHENPFQHDCCCLVKPR